MNIKEMNNEELLKQYEHYKDIIKMPHSVKDMVIFYELEDELEKRERKRQEAIDFEEERIEGVDDE